MTVEGWCASAMLILGWWYWPSIGGLALNTAGTWLWACVAWQLAMWDLFALDLMLGAIQSRLLYREVRVKFGLATATFRNYRRPG